jgi:hypothetical protein
VDEKRGVFQGLVDRVLNGAGKASVKERARAFGNEGLAPPLDELIGKVATAPAQVTDADFAAALAAGVTEDQLFELVVCAAVGQSDRQYQAGLKALAEATATGPAESTGSAGATAPAESTGSAESTGASDAT